MNNLVINGTNLADIGVVISSGTNTYVGAERDVDYEVVPGKNAELTFDNGRFKNVDITYSGFVISDIEAKLRALRSLLASCRGYVRIADTYHPDEYRLGRYVQSFRPKVDYAHSYATFDMTFDCRAERFLKTGEIQQTFTSSGNITNSTSFDSRPQLIITGSGSFSIGDISVTIASHSFSSIVLDSEIEDAYSGSNNCNGLVTLTNHTYPTLAPGSNAITIGSGISKIVVTPRWYLI